MCFGLALAVGSPSNVSAYSLRQGKDGVQLHWKVDTLGVEVDTKSLAGVSGPHLMDQVRAAFVTWSANGVPSRSTFRDRKGAATATKDGRNMVRWIKSGWSHGKETVAITISWYRVSTGELLESDIVANAQDHRWAINPKKGSGLYDVQNIMAHEVGHFWGVGHSQEKSATMWIDSMPEQVSKRSLARDDRDGIAALVAAVNASTSAAHNPEPGEAAPMTTRAGGCSAAGDIREGGYALLLLIVLLLMSRHRRGVMVLLPAALMLWAAPAEADSRAGSSVERLADQAPLVFQGVVTRSESRMLRGLIVTDHTVRVRRCFKGPCPAERTLRTLGGVVGDLGMHASGEAQPRPGHELVMFAQAASGGVVRALSRGAGIYTITDEGAVESAGCRAAAAGSRRTNRSHHHPTRLVQLVNQIKRVVPGPDAAMKPKKQSTKQSAPPAAHSDTPEKRDQKEKR